jgi:hypothetical protein
MATEEIVVTAASRGPISVLDRGDAAEPLLLNLDIDLSDFPMPPNLEQSDLVVNTEHIKELIRQIKYVTDCDSLKLIVKQHLDEVKSLIKAALQEQIKQLEKILPILKLPGPNPFAIIKWLAKLVTGTAIPQLEAYIKYVQQIIELLQAVADLVDAIADAIPRLEACALEIVNQTKEDIEQTITNTIEDAISDIQKMVGDEVNEFASELGLDKVLKAINDIKDTIDDVNTLVDTISDIKNQMETAISDGLTRVATTQALITTATGVPATINTSSKEAFTTSVAGGALTTLKINAQAFVDAEPPVNTVAGTITGTTTFTSVLTINNGTWTGYAPITYAYQWNRSGVAIEGATASTYTLVLADVGSTISATITAENIAGYVSAETTATAVITNPYAPPVNTVAPAITGTVTVGSTLTCSQGTWTGEPTITFAFQWQFARTATAIAGATSSTYVIDVEDKNRTLNCKVTATNISGNVSATSSATIVVP